MNKKLQKGISMLTALLMTTALLPAAIHAASDETEETITFDQLEEFTGNASDRDIRLDDTHIMRLHSDNRNYDIKKEYGKYGKSSSDAAMSVTMENQKKNSDDTQTADIIIPINKEDYNKYISFSFEMVTDVNTWNSAVGAYVTPIYSGENKPAERKTCFVDTSQIVSPYDTTYIAADTLKPATNKWYTYEVIISPYSGTSVKYDFYYNGYLMKSESVANTAITSAENANDGEIRIGLSCYGRDKAATRLIDNVRYRTSEQELQAITPNWGFNKYIVMNGQNTIYLKEQKAGDLKNDVTGEANLTFVDALGNEVSDDSVLTSSNYARVSDSKGHEFYYTCAAGKTASQEVFVFDNETNITLNEEPGSDLDKLIAANGKFGKLSNDTVLDWNVSADNATEGGNTAKNLGSLRAWSFNNQSAESFIHYSFAIATSGAENSSRLILEMNFAGNNSADRSNRYQNAIIDYNNEFLKSGIILQKNKWYNVDVVMTPRNGYTSVLDIYLNGEKCISQNCTFPIPMIKPDYTAPVFFKLYHEAKTTSPANTDKYIDDVKIEATSVYPNIAKSNLNTNEGYESYIDNNNLVITAEGQTPVDMFSDVPEAESISIIDANGTDVTDLAMERPFNPGQYIRYTDGDAVYIYTVKSGMIKSVDQYAIDYDAKTITGILSNTPCDTFLSKINTADGVEKKLYKDGVAVESGDVSGNMKLRLSKSTLTEEYTVELAAKQFVSDYSNVNCTVSNQGNSNLKSLVGTSTTVSDDDLFIKTEQDSQKGNVMHIHRGDIEGIDNQGIKYGYMESKVGAKFVYKVALKIDKGSFEFLTKVKKGSGSSLETLMALRNGKLEVGGEILDTFEFGKWYDIALVADYESGDYVLTANDTIYTGNSTDFKSYDGFSDFRQFRASSDVPTDIYISSVEFYELESYQSAVVETGIGKTAAEENHLISIETSKTNNAYSANVYFYTNKEMSADVMLAIYDSYGNLVGVTLDNENILSTGSKEVTCPITENFNNAKVFVWDANMKPLADRIEFN